MFHTTVDAFGWQNTSAFLSDRGNHEAVSQKQIKQNTHYTHSIFASRTLTPALPLKDQTYCQIRPCPCPCSTPSVKVSTKGPHSAAKQSISISHIISRQNTSISQIKWNQDKYHSLKSNQPKDQSHKQTIKQPLNQTNALLKHWSSQTNQINPPTNQTNSKEM